MSEMLIVRNKDGKFVGLREDDDRAWKAFKRRMNAMETGELIKIDAVIPRNYKFLKKFFALLTVGFDAWQPPRKRLKFRGKPVAKSFEAFRKEVTILAGFYEQTFDLRGRMKLEAQSISFAAMDDAEFEKVYSAVVDVLLAEVLKTYRGRAELDEVVERIMGFV